MASLVFQVSSLNLYTNSELIGTCLLAELGTVDQLLARDHYKRTPPWPAGLLLTVSELLFGGFCVCEQSVVVGGWTGKFGVSHIPATELQLLKPLDYVVDATFVCL